MDYNVKIEVRYATDAWGPFAINLEDGIPSDAVVTDCTIEAYVGKVLPSDDLLLLDNVALDLIEPGSISCSEQLVSWKMQYAAALKGYRYTLVFEVEINNTSIHPFYLYSVDVV